MNPLSSAVRINVAAPLSSSTLQIIFSSNCRSWWLTCCRSKAASLGPSSPDEETRGCPDPGQPCPPPSRLCRRDKRECSHCSGCPGGTQKPAGKLGAYDVEAGLLRSDLELLLPTRCWTKAGADLRGCWLLEERVGFVFLLILALVSFPSGSQEKEVRQRWSSHLPSLGWRAACCR